MNARIRKLTKNLDFAKRQLQIIRDQTGSLEAAKKVASDALCVLYSPRKK